MQGLNEVLAPLFYVLKNDLDTSNSVRFFFHTQAKAVKQPSFVSSVSTAVAMMKSYVEHFSQSGLRKSASYGASQLFYLISAFAF